MGYCLSRLDAIVIIMLPLIFVIQTNSMQHVNNYKAFIPAEMTTISLMTITKLLIMNFDTNSSY